MTDRPPVVLTSILNFRTVDMTLRAVNSALIAMEGIAGEIVVVDNGSDDGSYERLCKQAAIEGWDKGSRVRIMSSGRNGGFGAGHNVTIQAGMEDGTQPDYVYVLNSDAFPAADAIRQLLQSLEDDPSVGLAGSYIHGPDGDPHCTCFRFPSAAGEFAAAARLGIVSRLFAKSVVAMPIPDHTIDLDWTAGASLMMRQSALNDIGIFDETFFLYYEETDLCHRARAAGWRVIYVRESEVAHIGSASTGMKTWKRIPSYYLDSRLYYYVKTHGAVYAAAATAAYTMGAILDGLRNIVKPRPRLRPEHYVRDMLVHHSRAAVTGIGRRLGMVRPTKPISDA